MGKKVLWAQLGWEESVHANGILKDIVNPETGSVLGQEREGTDSFYANAGGCQLCHTGEGFLKNINGEYANADAIEADVITHPSSINCFTCHAPHDSKDFSLTVANGTKVTLQSGSEYTKDKGSLCASCHQARLDGHESANDYVLTTVQNSGISSQRTAVHHGPQTDMLLGTAGATYSGKEYANSKHTSNNLAHCIQCHYSFPDESRASLSPGVGGHSFEVIGKVHGSDKANTSGCTDCHSSAKGTTLSGTGYLNGLTYIDIGNGTTDVDAMNKVLVALADPDNSCAGLLESAMVKLQGDDASKGFKWSSDGKCVFSGLNAKVAAKAGAADGDPEVRMLKAMYNWGYAYFEDRSFGAHNNKLAMQLLIDTCEDLKNYTGSSVDCGTRP